MRAIFFSNWHLQVILRLVIHDNFVLIWPLTDVDECIQKFKGNCSHACVNKPGGYYCKCPNGFQMSQDNKTCNCPKGFKESANGTMCLGKFQNKDSAGKKKRTTALNVHPAL